MKTYFLTILVLVLSFGSSTAQETTLFSDSELYQLLEETSLASLPLDTIFEKVSNAFYDMQSEEIAMHIKEDLWEILDRAKQTNDPIIIGRAHGMIASWHAYNMFSDQPDSIYFHDQKTLEYYLKTDDQLRISRAYRQIGTDLRNKGLYDKAEQYYFKSLTIAEAVDSEEDVYRTYSYLAILYKITKDYNSSLQYREKIVANYEAAGETHPLIRALLGLSENYIKLEQPQKALDATNNALTLIQELREEIQEEETVNARAFRGRAYVALEQYDKALEDFLFTYENIVTEYGSEQASGWTDGIGNVYRLKGDCDKAIPYLRAFVHYFDERRNTLPEELINSTTWLAECYQEKQQLDSVLFYFNYGNTLTINQVEEELAAVKNELRIKYDTEQKEATIATQSTQIQQQKRIQQLSFGIGGLLTLLLGGLFLTYRNNRKKNLQLQELNEDLEDTNSQLDQRNAQNELLLKEIHHRVKNNLETVSSLLELQSAQVEDDEVQSVMQASQSRVQSMSILHQKLYQGEDLASIEMKDYFRNLAESILDTYDAWDEVEIEYDMEEIELDVDTAVPIGLIVNELLTNALKYAFTDNTQAKVVISLNKVDENVLELVVADNGIGKIAGIESKGTGFGSQLMALLTRQLNGTMREEMEDGLRSTFEFNTLSYT